MRRIAGFTLIELVIVMVVISVGLLGLTGLFSNSTTTLTANENLQRATQYAQQCAEQVLATRRNSTNFTVASFTIPTVCSGNSDGFVRTATASAAYTNTGSACNGNAQCPCPSGGTINCRDINISVAKGATSSSITVMLVDY